MLLGIEVLHYPDHTAFHILKCTHCHQFHWIHTSLAFTQVIHIFYELGWKAYDEIGDLSWACPACHHILPSDPSPLEESVLQQAEYNTFVMLTNKGLIDEEAHAA